jgi:hypothetical protein
MADPVTAEEIAELVGFCQDELVSRERNEIEDEYILPAKRALAIAEKLPALLAERETLEKERDEWRALYSRDLDPPVCRLQVPDGWVPGNAREAAEGWHAAYEQASADRDALKKERDDAVTLGWKAAHDAVLSMQANWHQDCRSDEQRNALMEVATSIADELRHMSPGDYLDVKWKDAQNAIASERRAEFAESERDRLAAEVERLKRLCSGGAYDTLQSEQAWKRRAESAERESTAANAALQKIGMSLGSSDEWTDQATMIADVDGRVAAARETIANLREAVANISCGCGTMCMFMKPREACERHAATKALAQLDAPPSPTRRDAAVSRALFRDAEAGACGEKVEDGAQQWMPKTDDPIDGATETIALTRLAQAERALVEAVEIMRPFAISVSEDGWLLRLPKDAAAYRAARAFVEQHGGAK